MDRTQLTALSLSLLVLPGAGHWYLGRRMAGGIYAAISLIALLYPLLRYVRAMSSALHEIATAAPSAMGSAITALSTAWTRESPALMAGLLALLLCWLIAAADLLRRR